MDKEKEVERLAQDIADICPDMVEDGCEQQCYSCLAVGLTMRGYGNVKQYKEEIERLRTELSHREEDLIHADEEVFYRECDVVLRENAIKEKALTEYAKRIKQKAKTLHEPNGEWYENVRVCDINDTLKEFLEK